MTTGFAIVLLACSAQNCEAVPAEPGVSYPTVEQCQSALASKSGPLGEAARAQRQLGRTTEIVCLRQEQAIQDVEQRYDVLETMIAHAEPNSTSAPVGVVQRGETTLVNGVVTGTAWVRVVLRDGRTGFVFGDRLKRAQTGGTRREHRLWLQPRRRRNRRRRRVRLRPRLRPEPPSRRDRP